MTVLHLNSVMTVVRLLLVLGLLLRPNFAFVIGFPSAIVGAVNNPAFANLTGGSLVKPRVDCVVGEWSGWGVSVNLAASADTTTFTRSRQILLASQNGGQQCPPLYQVRLINAGGLYDPNLFNPDTSTTTTTTTTKTTTSPTTTTATTPTPTTTTTTTPPTTTTTTTLPPAKTTPAREATKKRDILFLVDMSGSLNEAEFAKVMESLALVVDRLCEEVTPGRNSPLRIAMATFDHRIVHNFDFNRFSTKEQIKAAMKMTRPLGGATCTGEALQYASQVMFQEAAGSRPDAVKDVLLLTDGLWNCGVDAQAAANTLKQKANVYSLLIGHFTSSGFQQMNSLLSGPSDTHLFSLRNVDQLHHLVYLLKADFPLKPFRGCAPARIPKPRQPNQPSTIVVPEVNRRSTIVVPETPATIGQEKTTMSQYTSPPGQVKTTNRPVQTKQPITPGQAKTTIGQLTDAPGQVTTKGSIAPNQAKTTIGQFTNPPAQRKTTLGQIHNSPAQITTTIGQLTTTIGQLTTTIGQLTNAPVQQKTTIPNLLPRIPSTPGQSKTSAPSQEKTTIGQLTSTAGQMKTSVGQLTSTAGQIKTSVGQLTSTVGQMKTSVGQFTSSAGQIKTSVGQFTTTVGQFSNTPVQIKTSVSQEKTSPPSIRTTTTAAQQKTDAPAPQQRTTTIGQLTNGPYQTKTYANETPAQKNPTLGQLHSSLGQLKTTVTPRTYTNQITTRASYPVKAL